MYKQAILTHSDEEIIAESKLLGTAFNNPKLFTEDYLRWQYLENPDGKALGFNAYSDGGELAAHYVTQPLRAKLFGKEVKGLLSLNTATHPSHTGKGLFTSLANSTYEEAKKLNYSFVIGVANQNSTHGFVNKLGFKLIGPLKAMIGIGNDFILKANRSSDANSDYARIWNKQSLAWRVKNPNVNYEIKRTRDQFMVLADSGKPLVGSVLGCYGNDLLPETTPQKIKNKLFNLWISAGKNEGPSNSFYVNIPSSLRPSPLNLIFKNLQEPELAPDFGKIVFSAMDFDAY